MALLEGKTPEQMASEATEDVLLQVSQSLHESLVEIARYDNRDTIKLRGEKFWERNKEELIADSIGKHTRTISKYIAKQKHEQEMAYFLLLRSKGMSIEEAQKEAGINL